MSGQIVVYLYNGILHGNKKNNLLIWKKLNSKRCWENSDKKWVHEVWNSRIGKLIYSDRKHITACLGPGGWKGAKMNFWRWWNVIYLDLMVFNRCIHFSKTHWPCELNGCILLHAKFNSIRLIIIFLMWRSRKSMEAFRTVPD